MGREGYQHSPSTCHGRVVINLTRVITNNPGLSHCGNLSVGGAGISEAALNNRRLGGLSGITLNHHLPNVRRQPWWAPFISLWRGGDKTWPVLIIIISNYLQKPLIPFW